MYKNDCRRVVFLCFDYLTKQESHSLYGLASDNGDVNVENILEHCECNTILQLMFSNIEKKSWTFAAFFQCADGT